MGKRSVGILLFDEVEVLDFAGPFEVFSVTETPGGLGKAFQVVTVAQEEKPIKARNGLTVLPQCGFEDAPDFDVMIVPGGYGAEMIEIRNATLIDWLKERAKSTPLIASVCTGAFLLAEAGLLDGKRATTHWMDIARLAREYPLISVARDVRFVDEGSIVTSGGISAGIDMSLHLVSRLLGEEAAKATARRMEYKAYT